VFLALNPGGAVLRFQGRSGRFAKEIRDQYDGSYAAWAASWPYLRRPWGMNRHYTSRLRFLRDWLGEPDLPASAMVAFELYPWHSKILIGALTLDARDLRRHVWNPVTELGAPVFAFGARWFDILENDLALSVICRLGKGGEPYGSRVPSRAVAIFRSDDGITVIAEKHAGSAGPPSRGETRLLRRAVDYLCTDAKHEATR
jgi:hypothetical protein